MPPPLYPPPCNQSLYITDPDRVRQLYDYDFRFQLEDYQTYNTMRGPVQGWPAGGTRWGGRRR